MIKVAQNYKDELNKKVVDTWNDPKYKYYHICGYRHLPRLNNDDNCWQRQYVSINKQGTVIGYISYSLNKTGTCADNLSIMSFDEDNPIIFALDLKTVIIEFFTKYGGRSLVFSGVVGNPALPKYRRIIKHIGGKEIGTLRNSCVLEDGKYYDEVLFQVLREDILKRKGACENNESI